jgi:hypothetical protein
LFAEIEKNQANLKERQWSSRPKFELGASPGDESLSDNIGKAAFYFKCITEEQIIKTAH